MSEKKGKDSVEHYRDAETGQYTTKKEAEKNPKTTVKEHDRKKK